MTGAVFLDRDGTIIEDTGFPHRKQHLIFLPGAIKGLRWLKENKYRLFIVTNQSGIGRGIYSLEQYKNFHRLMMNELNKNGIEITDTFYCPHTPEDNCLCRKPNIQLLIDAKRKYGVDLSQSYFIGDKQSDVICGQNARCITILIEGSKDYLPRNLNADYIIKDLGQVDKIIPKR